MPMTSNITCESASGTESIGNRPKAYRKIRVALLATTALAAMLVAGAPESACAQTRYGSGYASLATRIDPLVRTFMQDEDTRVLGLTIAVSRNGKLLFNSGYGVADQAAETPMYPWMRSNIGSVSKAVVTGPVGWKLMAEKGINPKTKRLYGTNGVFGSDYQLSQDMGDLRYNPIVSMAIGPQDKVYTWYSDQTMSIGTSDDLSAHQSPVHYDIPLNRTPADIRAIDIAGNGRVYVWYDDRTRSIGTPTNLGAHEVPQFDENGKAVNPVSLAPGRSILNVIDMAIASNDHVYAWYDDGTVSSGTSLDLDAYRAPYAFTAPSVSRYRIRGIGIAANDRVYAWYTNNHTTNGTSDDLDRHGGSGYTIPLGPLLDSPSLLPWYEDITLQHLLDHKAGFARSGDLRGAARRYGVSEANVTYDQLHRYMLQTRKLESEPGSTYSYSNHGFGLWTLIVPRLEPGVSYKQYAVNSYLKPLGLHNSVKERSATLDSAMSRGYAFSQDTGSFVERALAGDPQGLASGGWTASAQALVRITNHLMTTYGATAVDDMGWTYKAPGKLSKDGDTGGGAAFVAIFPQGYTSVSGKNLSNVHVAIAANTEVGSSKLDSLASSIALAVPDSNVPANYDLW